MPCTLIKTSHSLVLELKIELDANNTLDNSTIASLKKHTQQTLLSRHYKYFIWDLSGINYFDSRFISKILMAQEKAYNTHCEFHLVNVGDELYEKLTIMNLVHKIIVKKGFESPTSETLSKYLQLDDEAVISIFSHKDDTKSISQDIMSDIDDIFASTQPKQDANLLNKLTSNSDKISSDEENNDSETVITDDDNNSEISTIEGNMTEQNPTTENNSNLIEITHEESIAETEEALNESLENILDDDVEEEVPFIENPSQKDEISFENRRRTEHFLDQILSTPQQK